MDEHGLDRLVTKMMNGLIADKPADPKVYMAQWLAARCTDKQLEEAGLVKKVKSGNAVRR